MPKSKSIYICSECGFESAKWYGKCPGCGEWNTMNEEFKEAVKHTASVLRPGESGRLKAAPILINEINTDDEQRYHTGLKELDRVLGGGIVKASLVLLGGDPGIGKSTILLQVCQELGKTLKILYVSGEESKRQLKLRATRLGVNSDHLYILTETDVEYIIEAIRSEKPDLVIIDSIQTMSLGDLSSSPGSITQVRECTNAFMRTAKSLDIPILVVGHVNKDGAIAGPKVLEHIVDAVLYFEGDRQMSYRILRAVKNRYGSTNEIGVFEMAENGLREVENPSMMLRKAEKRLRHMRGLRDGGYPANISGGSGLGHFFWLWKSQENVHRLRLQPDEPSAGSFRKTGRIFLFQFRRLSERGGRPTIRRASGRPSGSYGAGFQFKGRTCQRKRPGLWRNWLGG